jgi:3-deoxy-D-manno-octulosonic-acid transferase
MILLYKIISYLLLPFILLRLCYKSKQHKGYLQNIDERFGIYTQEKLPKNKPYIWVHAVSVGETKACQTLIQELVLTYPNHNILLTNTTPTGRDIANQIFSEFIQDKRLYQSYLPYDAPLLVSSFLNYVKPVFGIILESEIWPNLLLEAKKKNIKLVLANARMSPKSYKRMSYFKSHVTKLLSCFDIIAAQTQVDFDYYKELGAKNLALMGNLKFDCLPSKSFVEKANYFKNHDSSVLFSNSKQIALLASTREGEEETLIQAWLNAEKPCNLIVLPRHLHRLQDIKKYLQEKEINYTLRTDLEKVFSNNEKHDHEIILGDTMGEMPFYIELCDIVVMGGSWLPFGGQNILEPAMQGRVVLVGEHTYNFLEATKKAVEMQACFRFSSPNDAFKNMNEILQNSKQLEANALRFVETYQGATKNLMNIIKKYAT